MNDEIHFPAPPLKLCIRCELALGHWSPERPLCPACYRIEHRMAGE
jgi:hypothetical protein